MNEQPASVMDGQRQRLLAALEDLLRDPAMVGAALVGRDGVCSVDCWRRERWNRETLSAMSATLLAAAEVALADPLLGEVPRVLAETRGVRLCALGVTPEVLLIALADTSLPLERFVARVDIAVAAAETVLSG